MSARNHRSSNIPRVRIRTHLHTCTPSSYQPITTSKQPINRTCAIIAPILPEAERRPMAEERTSVGNAIGRKEEGRSKKHILVMRQRSGHPLGMLYACVCVCVCVRESVCVKEINVFSIQSSSYHTHAQTLHGVFSFLSLIPSFYQPQDIHPSSNQILSLLFLFCSSSSSLPLFLFSSSSLPLPHFLFSPSAESTSSAFQPATDAAWKTHAEITTPALNSFGLFTANAKHLLGRVIDGKHVNGLMGRHRDTERETHIDS